MFQNTPLGNLYPVWEIYETNTESPIRWSLYHEKNPDLLKQTSFSHTASFLSVALPVLWRLAKYANYDIFLLIYAISRHDVPEWLRNIDVHGPRKTEKDDLAEYEAFHEKIRHLPKDLYKIEERAYLLQFAAKCPEIFPTQAKEVMRRLKETNPSDVLAFPALESWEYAFYGYHVYKKHNYPVTLTHVLRTELFKLQKSAATLPGFREEIFTHEYEEWVLKFLEEHKDVPEGREYFKEHYVVAEK